VILRNYEGFIATYAEPSDFVQLDEKHYTGFCKETNRSNDGVILLSKGNKITIEPKITKRVQRGKKFQKTDE
jgi:hypothetical protein